MARPGDQLAAGVEEALEVGCHRVHRSRELGDLGRTLLGGTSREVASCERPGRLAKALERPHERAREEERRDDGDRSRSDRDGEDLHVVPHVEHHPPREEHRGEREADREDGEARELEPDGGEEAQHADGAEAHGERRRGDRDGARDHGANR